MKLSAEQKALIKRLLILQMAIEKSKGNCLTAKQCLAILLKELNQKQAI